MTRPHLVVALGAASAVVVATAVSMSAATALPAPVAISQPARAAAGDATSAPSPTAPHVGVVRGTLSGAAAVRAAGKAVGTFRLLHDQRVAAFRARAAGGKPAANPGAAPAAGHAKPADTVHDFWGPEPAQGSVDGNQATQSVNPELRLSVSGDVVYAPTLKPAGPSCVENVTAYQNGQAPQVWAWDWCGSQGPAKTLNIDDNFIKTYTQQVNGHPAYSVQEVQTDAGGNAWTTYLYNYTTKSWEQFFSSSGTDQSKLGYGWDIFEIYASPQPNYCDDMGSDVYESSSIQSRRGGASGSWSPITAQDAPINPGGGNYQCSGIKEEVLHPNDHWSVHK